MKILVCGGDERFVLLSELLQKAGTRSNAMRSPARSFRRAV